MHDQRSPLTNTSVNFDGQRGENYEYPISSLAVMIVLPGESPQNNFGYRHAPYDQDRDHPQSDHITTINISLNGNPAISGRTHYYGARKFKIILDTAMPHMINIVIIHNLIRITTINII